MNLKCHHVGIMTNNPRGLIDFYCAKLGFEESGTTLVSQDLMEHIFGIPTPCTLTKMRRDDVLLEILHPQRLELKQNPFDAAGMNHWSLGVKDRDSFMAELESKDMAVVEFQKDEKAIIFLKDPDGNLVEIYEA